MLSWHRAGVCFGLAALSTIPPSTLSHGADISVHFGTKRPNAEFVIRGDISVGDDKVFNEKVNQAWRLGYVPRSVYSYSNGGDLRAAMGIGRIVRSLLMETEAPFKSGEYKHLCGFTVGLISSNKELVTTFDPVSGKGDQNCNCASACFFIWSAGVKRDGDVIGIHRPSYNRENFSALTPNEAERSYGSLSEVVETYLSDMNVPHRLIEDMLGTSSSFVSYVDSQTLDVMRTVPFYEELKIARCGSLSPAEKEGSEALIRRLLSKRRLTDDEVAFDGAYSEKLRAIGDCERALRKEHVESVLGKN